MFFPSSGSAAESSTEGTLRFLCCFICWRGCHQQRIFHVDPHQLNVVVAMVAEVAVAEVLNQTKNSIYRIVELSLVMDLHLRGPTKMCSELLHFLFFLSIISRRTSWAC